MTSFIYLASQSPRRRQLLDQIGVRHELLLPGADEDAEALEVERPGESPTDYCARVTRAKWDAALARRRARALPDAPILCADTTVALGHQILGKPADPTDAARILSLLSGQRHAVITAVCVGDEARVSAQLSISTVEFCDLSPLQVERYIDSGEPFGKAGAYAIQSQAAAWIAHIAGSYSGIMGLPLFETAQLLQEWGFEF
jgi:septum formation protein